MTNFRPTGIHTSATKHSYNPAPQQNPTIDNTLYHCLMRQPTGANTAEEGPQ